MTTCAIFSCNSFPQPGSTSATSSSDFNDRNAISSILMRCRDGHGDDWADIIDMLTTYPGARRRVIRVLGEIDAR
jgi:hypothetical protein